ncbi:MAG TPA: NAD(P)H-dependent oxidoreductase [Kribbella sp.]|uniref:FMN-dependent NADH-azoreductase n=1 Tax=Kribbella sp. TaxID=1871183 RepID=UPI002D79B03B|nr:NAD(P)H-dependent oxidoreductase [Kribbella sp.]HET6294370.1 NAD(P)H-dependent oxidoreductase [Kribbella sp.]
MPTLLHIESSVSPEGVSVSREVTGSFLRAWTAQNPSGTVIHRDLAIGTVPYPDFPTALSAFVPSADARTPEQKAGFALREELAAELERADVVLIGAPMYNWTIAPTLKTWLDHVLIPGRTFGAAEPTAAGKPAVVVASRGSAYGPGAPREGWDFVIPYLSKALGEALGLDVHFIVPELTTAHLFPGMEDFVDAANASRAAAIAQGAELANTLSVKAAA